MIHSSIALALTEVVQNLEDIKPPILEHSFWGLIGMLAALLFAAVLAYVCWPDRSKTISPPLLPKEWAQTELARINEEIAALEPGEAAFRVSQILRSFLERQYGLRATRQSTEEFLASTAEQKLFDPVRKERLQDFLESCDQLKFAKAVAGAAPTMLLHQATSWVNETA
jgi:hypothetical protein